MTKKFDYSEIHPTKDKQFGRYNANTIPKIVMNSDGEPWKKCCKANSDGVNCAYVDKRLQKSETWQAQYPFICTHRTEPDGTYRVCAGWHCCHGDNQKGDKDDQGNGNGGS